MGMAHEENKSSARLQFMDKVKKLMSKLIDYASIKVTVTRWESC